MKSSDTDGLSPEVAVPSEVMLPTGEVVWMRVVREAPARGAEPLPGAESEGAPDVGGFPWRHDPDRSGDVGGEDGQIARLVGFSEAVSGIAHSVHESLAGIRPHHVEIEFGLDIDGSTGKVLSLVADVHAKASIKVKIGWDPEYRRGHRSDRSDGSDGSDGIDGIDGIGGSECSDNSDDMGETDR